MKASRILAISFAFNFGLLGLNALLLLRPPATPRVLVLRGGERAGVPDVALDLIANLQALGYSEQAIREIVGPQLTADLAGRDTEEPSASVPVRSALGIVSGQEAPAASGWSGPEGSRPGGGGLRSVAARSVAVGEVSAGAKSPGASASRLTLAKSLAIARADALAGKNPTRTQPTPASAEARSSVATITSAASVDGTSNAEAVVEAPVSGARTEGPLVAVGSSSPAAREKPQSPQFAAPTPNPKYRQLYTVEQQQERAKNGWAGFYYEIDPEP